MLFLQNLLASYKQFSGASTADTKIRSYKNGTLREEYPSRFTHQPPRSVPLWEGAIPRSTKQRSPSESSVQSTSPSSLYPLYTMKRTTSMRRNSQPQVPPSSDHDIPLKIVTETDDRIKLFNGYRDREGPKKKKTKEKVPTLFKPSSTSGMPTPFARQNSQLPFRVTINDESIPMTPPSNHPSETSSHQPHTQENNENHSFSDKSQHYTTNQPDSLQSPICAVLPLSSRSSPQPSHHIVPPQHVSTTGRVKREPLFHSEVPPPFPSRSSPPSSLPPSLSSSLSRSPTYYLSCKAPQMPQSTLPYRTNTEKESLKRNGARDVWSPSRTMNGSPPDTFNTVGRNGFRTMACTITQRPLVLPGSYQSLEILSLGDITVQYFDLNRFLGRGGKIRLFLRMKQIKHTYEAYSLHSQFLFQQRKRELIRTGVSPTGHLPVLIHEGKTFCETHAILRYLAKQLGEYGLAQENEDYFADMLMEKLSYWTDDLMGAIKENLNGVMAEHTLAYLKRRLGYYTLMDLLLGRIRSLWLSPHSFNAQPQATYSVQEHNKKKIDSEWVPTWYDAALVATLFDDMQLMALLYETGQLEMTIQKNLLQNTSNKNAFSLECCLLDQDGHDTARQTFPMLYEYYLDVTDKPLVLEMFCESEVMRRNQLRQSQITQQKRNERESATSSCQDFYPGTTRPPKRSSTEPPIRVTHLEHKSPESYSAEHFISENNPSEPPKPTSLQDTTHGSTPPRFVSPHPSQQTCVSRNRSRHSTLESHGRSPVSPFAHVQHISFGTTTSDKNKLVDPYDPILNTHKLYHPKNHPRLSKPGNSSPSTSLMHSNNQKIHSSNHTEIYPSPFLWNTPLNHTSKESNPYTNALPQPKHVNSSYKYPTEHYQATTPMNSFQCRRATHVP